MIDINRCAIDTTTRDVLIQLSMAEGLIEPLGFAEEHYVTGLNSRRFPRWVQRQALEQLVLSQELLSVDPSGWGTLRAWHGPLIEEGVLREVEPLTGQASHAEVPVEAFLGILRARGHKGNVRELRRQFSRANELLDEYERLSRAHPGLENQALAADIADRTGIRTVVGRRDSTDMSKDALAKYRKLKGDLAGMDPLAVGFSHYLAALAIARQMQCLVRCPIRSDVATRKVSSLDNAHAVVGAEMVLLRVVCKRLSRVPIRPTVRETLALSRTPAASSMRLMLGEWLAALHSGEVNILDRIESDVEKAQAGLARAGALGEHGRWLTWLTVPVAVAEMLAGSPGLVAFTIGGVAAGHEAERYQLEHKHRWAMFAGE
jgi:hypothetical protein